MTQALNYYERCLLALDDADRMGFFCSRFVSDARAVLQRHGFVCGTELHRMKGGEQIIEFILHRANPFHNDEPDCAFCKMGLPKGTGF